MRETPLCSTVRRTTPSQRDQLRAGRLIAVMTMLVTAGCGFYMGDGFSSASGHVIGPEGDRLAYYTVKLFEPGTRILVLEKFISDDHDFDIMESHAPGSGFILTIEKPGYATFEREISGDVKGMEIKLSPNTSRR